MRKMVYLPYVRFEQEEGEAEGLPVILQSNFTVVPHIKD